VATGSEQAGPAPAPPQPAAGKCEPLQAVIKGKLEAGLTAQRICQDLATEHGFAGAYNSVKRMARRLTGGQELPFRRIKCEPGTEAQAQAAGRAASLRARPPHANSRTI